MEPLPVTESSELWLGHVTRLYKVNELLIMSGEPGVKMVLTVLKDPLSNPFEYYFLGRKIGNMMRVSGIS